MTTYYACTLGCKVNSYETASVCTRLGDFGYGSTDDVSKADVIIVNTCFVTSKAGQKSRQHISSFRQSNPSATLLVMGCYSQQESDKVVELGANIVIGTSSRHKCVDYIEQYSKTHQTIVDINPAMREQSSYEELGENAYCESTRAFLKIQDGCDSFCSYCYIPTLRGKSRSREPRYIVEEAVDLVKKGYREIVLTGIHIGKYGYDLQPRFPLSELIKAILSKCPDLWRLRVSSLEESEIDEGFLELLKKESRLVDHLHIPLQSGSQRVLYDMSRPYKKEDFLDKLRRIREIRPDIAITTDIIVGYPTETEEDFQESLSFARECAFAEIHVFPFSSRPKTRAALLKDLNPAIKKDRVHRMIALSKQMRSEYEQRFIGKEVEVLVEKSEGGICIGHTPNYLLLRFKNPSCQRNNLVNVIYDNSTASD